MNPYQPPEAGEPGALEESPKEPAAKRISVGHQPVIIFGVMAAFYLIIFPFFRALWSFLGVLFRG